MNWAPQLTAVSTAIIALVVIAAGVVGISVMRRIGRALDELNGTLRQLREQAQPAIESARSVLNNASDMTKNLRVEVDRITDATGDVRRRVLRAVDRTEERLVDLDALLDVIQEEVEDTVLDVGAALRTTRRGSQIIKSMKRAFVGKKRRRR